MNSRCKLHLMLHSFRCARYFVIHPDPYAVTHFSRYTLQPLHTSTDKLLFALLDILLFTMVIYSYIYRSSHQMLLRWRSTVHMNFGRAVIRPIRFGSWIKRYNHSRCIFCMTAGARFSFPAITSKLPPTPIITGT